MNWKRKRVVVTGGAGFIGSNMTDRLLAEGADVKVVDKLQLSSGSLSWNRKLARLGAHRHQRSDILRRSPSNFLHG